MFEKIKMLKIGEHFLKVKINDIKSICLLILKNTSLYDITVTPQIIIILMP